MTNGFLCQGQWQYDKSSRTPQALLFISSRTYLAKKISEPSGIKIKKTKNIYEIMTPCTIEFIELVQIFRLFYSKHFIFVVISIVVIN